MFQHRVQSLVLRLPYALSQSPRHCRKNLPPSLTTRNLSVTAPRHATDPSNLDNAALLAALKETTVYKKISQQPGALLAIQNFAQVLQKQGVDASKAMSLSTFQMSKLFLDAEFREASKNLMEEFRRAGIDPKDKAMVDEITNIMKLIPKP